MSAELVPIQHEAPAIKTWNEDQVRIVRQQMMPKDATDDDFAYFLQSCQHQLLDPTRGEIVPVFRWSKKDQRNVMAIQVTAEGLRTIAERSGLYAGSDPPQWCGPDMVWHDVWLDTTTPPAACRVAVHRRDWAAPAVGVVRYASFVQLDSQGGPTPLWKKMPDHMLAKCAEAAALKKAFPKELARAGIDARDLTDAQRVVIEAKAIGLDDDGRHALIEEVTDGRTNSSTNLTDDERLATRAAIAGQRPDGPQPTPGRSDWYTVNGWRDQGEHDAYRDHAIQLLKDAPPERQAAFKAWREKTAVPPYSQAHTRTHADLVASHILDILKPEGTEATAPGAEDADSPAAAPAPQPAPQQGTDQDQTFAQKITRRLSHLNPDERKKFLEWCAETGISEDPYTRIETLTEDQLHTIDAYLDLQDETPF